MSDNEHMTIPEAAVEAAARAMYAQDGGTGEFALWVYQDYAKAMVEAAAPHMTRTITTAAERATVKPGAIGVDADGNAWKRGTGSWVSTGSDTAPLYDDMDYTLTILREGATK